MSHSPNGTGTHTHAPTDAMGELPVSPDPSPSPPPAPNGVNGHTDDDEEDPIVKLQNELDRTREEKDTLAAQYRTLLAKLTQMRTTLGNKLKQDAEELDRREQLIQTLTAQNDDLTSTVETLKHELVSSHADSERASAELDALRSTVLTEGERELREAHAELERCRMERDEWERVALRERAEGEEGKEMLDMARRDLELERERRETEGEELARERERAGNLQSVLQDFQSAKDHELRQAVKDYEAQLMQVTQSLAEYKHRALTAELELEESNTNITRTHELENEVKEKNALIGKLRHEAVIINEHLIEALRRLRRTSTDTNVDRRLVTNVLLAFLTTPRTDGKRFEMLSLLASILQWSEGEREKAGLVKGHGHVGSPGESGGGGRGGGGLFWGRGGADKGKELEKTDETESFSRLWVEFLLTEANAGESPSASSPPPPSRNGNGKSSLPGTPTGGAFPGSGSTSPQALGRTRRLPSLTSPGMASSPNLSLFAPPKGKGKEKAGLGTES